MPSSRSLDDQQCSGTWQPQLNHAEIASWIAVISCHDTAGWYRLSKLDGDL